MPWRQNYTIKLACVLFETGTTNSIVVCISPLTSLMMDQQAKYSPLGLRTEFVGESQIDAAVKEKVRRGEVQLVYITPESIIDTSIYRDMLLSPPYQDKLVALVVDEAHCVKTWGDTFRTAFSKIGTLRSLVPKKVNMLALTATATTETFYTITKRLGMDNTSLVALPPNRDNITYEVHPKLEVDELASSLGHSLLASRTAFPKTVIYVRSYSDCSSVYMHLKRVMGSGFTDPEGSPNLAGFRLVDMFSRVLTNEKKDEVLKSFSKKDSVLRLIVATTAFGMGIDCPNIRQIMHWGMPSSLEEYVQETGRAGRDEEPSHAILYAGKGGRHSSTKVKNYVSNTTHCRRRLLFQEFLLYTEASIHVGGCKCCDVCRKCCTCESCSIHSR